MTVGFSDYRFCSSIVFNNSVTIATNINAALKEENKSLSTECPMKALTFRVILDLQDFFLKKQSEDPVTNTFWPF